MEIRNNFHNYKIWKEYGKPLYERKIVPLDSLSGTILAISILFAFAIPLISAQTLSPAFFPFAVGLSATLIAGGFYWVQFNINSYFKAKAQETLDKINEALKEENLIQIEKHVNHLLLPQFEMLKEKTKNLEAKFDLFKKQSALNKNTKLYEESKFEFNQALEKFKPENMN